MDNFVITELDRRHTGYQQFTHYISPICRSNLDTTLQFIEWRNWCWATFGPGMEREFATSLGSKQYTVCRWAWFTLENAKRIYFASPKELSQFCLKWA